MYYIITKWFAYSEFHNQNNAIHAARSKLWRQILMVKLNGSIFCFKQLILWLSIISEFLRHIFIPQQFSHILSWLLPSLTLVLCLMSVCQGGPEMAFSTMLVFNSQCTFYLLMSIILMWLSQCVTVQLISTHLCDLLYNDPSGVNMCHT